MDPLSGSIPPSSPTVGTPSASEATEVQLPAAEPNQATESADLDPALAQAATLSIDIPAGMVYEEEPLPSMAPKHYVQGIVQGQHAYLITNLLNGESQTLLQPQMVWMIGRNRQVAIPLPDKGLSRRHAVIQYIRQKGFCFIDLNSMNGSFINGQPVRQRYVLQDGDRIHLGNTLFIFFSSTRYQKLEPIHPEVLARLNALDDHPIAHKLDFLALEEPEITFRPNHEF